MKQVRLTIPVKIAITVAFLFMIITLVSVQIQYNELEEEQIKINERIYDVQDNIDELQNKLNAPFDKEYIIALAKEKLGYCLPEEIIFYTDMLR